MSDDWDDVYGQDATPVEETLISNILAQRNRIEELEKQNASLEAKLAQAVKAAFYEGFCEGLDDGWVWGEPSSAWKNSYALAEIKGEQP